MKFYSAYDRPSTIPCSSGCSDFVDYVEQVDKKTGVSCLVESGRKSIREYINSSFDETNIQLILARCKGDPKSLQRVDGFYADVTGVPSSVAELHASLTRAKEGFSTLPEDLRKEFDNDPNKFIAGFATGKVNNIIERMINNESKPGIPVQSDSASDSATE